MLSNQPAARISYAAAAILFAGAAAWCGYCAWADSLARIGSLQNLTAAVKMAPASAEYRFLLARAMEWGGDDNRDALLAALERNPRSAAVLIRLAQRSERDGDMASAEQYLLKAAEVDRTFDPPWALANFYFRAENYAHFWTWIRISMERAYGDSQALFDLCGRVPDGDRRALSLLPRDPDSLARYLRYLLTREKADAVAGSVAEELASVARPADRDLLLAACDRLIASQQSNSARAVWQRLGMASKDPPGLLTNARFTRQPMNRGFDWRLSPCEGATVRVSASPPSLAMEFSGMQTPECALAQQYFAPAASGTYRLTVEHESDPAKATGFVWALCDTDCRPLAPTGEHATNDGWTSTEYRFDASAGELRRLSFEYRRPLGSTRFEGTLRVRSATLEVAP